jgi:DNA-binding winged helix-turn-helix (wHTH) protein/tetratricopeptide (TPR) repeat protein
VRVYRFDRHRLDVDHQLLILNERVIPLSAKLFGILYCLVRSAGRTVTKDELVYDVWQSEDVSDATIVQHIWMLRKLLDERANSHRTILTVPRKGYRFIAPVTYVADAAADAERTGGETSSQRGEPRVWREYLTGMRYSEKRDLDGLHLALKHFNTALGIDPTFAPAWTGLAGTYSFLAYYGFDTWEHALPAALHAIEQALQLDPASALTHCVHSQIQLVQWDVVGSERSLDRAGNLDSGSPAVYQLSAFINICRGDFELAIADAKRTVAIVPNDVSAQGIFANALAIQGDFSNAIDAYTTILDLEPMCRIARQGRCEAYVASEEFQLAVQDLDLLPRTPANVSRLACIHAFTGDMLSASRMLRELESRSRAEHVEPHSIAQLQIALGRYNEALCLTEKAIADHDLPFAAMPNSPLLHRPMQDRRVREMLGGVRNLLRTPRRKIG